MKRNIGIVLSITISVVLITLIILLIFIYVVPIFNIASSQKSNQEILLMSSQSPDGKYNLEAYRTEPGATIDFSIKVYITNGNQKKLIYNAYHEYEVKIEWLDNSKVSINGITLDLSNGEKYDWRKK